MLFRRCLHVAVRTETRSTFFSLYNITVDATGHLKGAKEYMPYYAVKQPILPASFLGDVHGVQSLRFVRERLVKVAILSDIVVVPHFQCWGVVCRSCLETSAALTASSSVTSITRRGGNAKLGKQW